MKSKLLLFSASLLIICNPSFGQKAPENPKTKEVLSQIAGEKYHYLADWNEVCNLFIMDLYLGKDSSEINLDDYRLQWIENQYVVKSKNNEFSYTRNFEIDETKNNTVSLDVQILNHTYSNNYFAGLCFGSTEKNSGSKYVFLLGKNVNEKQFNYKIARTGQRFKDTSFIILAEGEIPDDGLTTQGSPDVYNSLRVKREGDKFEFSINNDIVNLLTINKGDIYTKNIGLWQFGKSLKVAYDNLEITGTNAVVNAKIEVPDIKVTPPKTITTTCKPFYKTKPSANWQYNSFLNSVIKDVDNKFENFREKKFAGQKRKTDVLSDASSRIGNSISFDINEYATLDEAMKEANNFLYNVPLGKGTCWELDTKLSSKDAYNYQNVYVVTNTNNDKVKVRIWVIKYSANTVDLQITVSDK